MDVPGLDHLLARSAFGTALFPKDGGYLLPVKVAIRRSEGIDEGDVVTVRMSVGA